MDGEKVIEGIITGAVGGASAGIFLSFVNYISESIQKRKHTERITRWLDSVTGDKDAKLWRSTHTIASYTNLTEERVRYICSESEKIVRSSKEEELWGLRGKSRLE